MTANPAESFTISTPHGSFTVQDNAGTIAIAMTGEYDLSSQEGAQRVTEYVGELLAQRPRLVAIDLTDLKFLDASGIRFVLSIQHVAQLTSATTQVRNPNLNIERLFAIVGLTALVDKP
jgi:anti-anti-sigma factor